MEIFIHLTRQNQIISEKIIERLKDYLIDPTINHFFIEIYQHLIERQKPLDYSIIQRILQFFTPQQWKELNENLQHRLGLFYKALADNQPKEADQKYLPFLLKPNQSIGVRKDISAAIQLLAEHRE